LQSGVSLGFFLLSGFKLPLFTWQMDAVRKLALAGGFETAMLFQQYYFKYAPRTSIFVANWPSKNFYGTILETIMTMVQQS